MRQVFVKDPPILTVYEIPTTKELLFIYFTALLHPDLQKMDKIWVKAKQGKTIEEDLIQLRPFTTVTIKTKEVTMKGLYKFFIFEAKEFSIKIENGEVEITGKLGLKKLHLEHKISIELNEEFKDKPANEDFRNGTSETLSDAVSYTHLTLPTICSV